MTDLAGRPTPSPSDAGSDDMKPSPSTWIAAGLGWQMAELYAESAVPPGDGDEDPADLPGMSALSLEQLLELRLTQIKAGIARLTEVFTAANLDADSVLDRVDAVQEVLGGAKAVRSSKLRPLIVELHVELFTCLTAARPRVGKAYGLGRALADLCLRPKTSEKAEFKRDFDGRVQTLTGWLKDLKSALPEHASEAIVSSLTLWGDWIDKTPADDRVWTADAPWQDPIHPSATTSIVTSALFAQGARWRAVLTGEKAATDLLTSSDLVAAGAALLQQFLALIGQFAARYWPIALVGVVAVVGIIVVVALLAHGLGAGLTALGAFAGALGLTWQGTRSTLGDVLTKAKEPLWGAQLDLAVTRALTQLPEGEAARIEVPGTGFQAIPGVSVAAPSVKVK
jgi:hypothetical protein